ncbi:hypothetical protein D3C78_1555940 [compost metagenome]
MGDGVPVLLAFVVELVLNDAQGRFGFVGADRLLLQALALFLGDGLGLLGMLAAQFVQLRLAYGLGMFEPQQVNGADSGCDQQRGRDDVQPAGHGSRSCGGMALGCWTRRTMPSTRARATLSQA